MRHGERRPGAERGSAAIEAVIVVPALMLFAGLILAAGRLAIAHQSVELAAAESARSASVARSAGDAQTEADVTAAATFDDRQLHCRSRSVALDTSQFSVPLGVAGHVTARIVCVVELGDVAIPGLPGAITIHAQATSPLDQYRQRRP